MRLSLLVILLLSLTACSSAARREAEMQEKIAQAWQGRSTEELMQHSYLLTLKRTKAVDKIIFTKQPEFNSQSKCAALGGCQGMFFSQGCQQTFFIKENKVTDYAAAGDCFVEMEWLLKRSKPQ